MLYTWIKTAYRRTSKLARLLTVILPLLPGVSFSQPALWQATRADQTFYLFGSIHVGLDDFYPLDQEIIDAFNKSDTLWVETEIDTATANEIAQAQQMARLPADQNLSDQLPAPTLDKLQQQAEKLGLSHQQLAHYQPWFVALVLTQQVMNHHGYSSELGVDLWFLRRARETNKPILGFETIKAQYNSLASLSSNQIELLDDTLNYLDELPLQLVDMVESWRSGKPEQLLQLLKDDVNAGLNQGPAYDALLPERNQKWHRRLLKESGSVAFIVVGALHLYDDDGLLSLLKSSGYEVKRINADETSVIR